MRRQVWTGLARPRPDRMGLDKPRQEQILKTYGKPTHVVKHATLEPLTEDHSWPWLGTLWFSSPAALAKKAFAAASRDWIS